MSSAPESLAVRLAQIADELRALSDAGEYWSDDAYQIERFQRVRSLAVQLQSLVDTRPKAEIEKIFSADLDIRTPLAVVDTAVFDPDGRILLIRRADNELWAMPGGACEMADTPAAAAAREVREETGVEVEITRLLGVFDSRLSGSASGRHLYHMLFAGAPVRGVPGPSPETLDARWFSLSDLPWNELSPGHAFRLQQAVQWQLNPKTLPYFDWQPPQHKE